MNVTDVSIGSINCDPNNADRVLFELHKLWATFYSHVKTHLPDRIIALRGMALAHQTSLSLPLFIEVPVLIQVSEQSCICALGLLILPLSTICLIEIWKCSDSVVFYFILLLSTACNLQFLDNVIYY